MKVYAKYVLSPGSAMNGSEELLEASLAFVRMKEALSSRITVGSCTVPPGLALVQNFAVHIMHFI